MPDIDSNAPTLFPQQPKPLSLLGIGMRLTEILALGLTPMKWIVEDLLPAGGVFLWAGEPKHAKKTWTLMHLLLCVVHGRPFLGRRTFRASVAYTFLEDGAARAGRRFHALGATDDASLDFCTVLSAEALDLLLAKLTEHKISAVVVIDTLTNYEVHAGVKDENSALAIEQLMKKLRAVVHATGSTFIIAHHFRKDGTTMRGSTALQGSCDGYFEVYRKKDVLVAQATLRDAKDTVFGYRVDLETVPAKFEEAEAPPEKETTETPFGLDHPDCEAVRDILRLSATGLSLEEIATRAHITKARAQKAVKALEQAGEIGRPDGKRRGYRATASMRCAPVSLADLLAPVEPPAAGSMPN